MQRLPITKMTLYKHGVGFFERRAQLREEAISLAYRVEEMNDVLKSLTVIDWGDGKVLGIDYATPKSREERLAGCTIDLRENQNLQDLLIGLRGRRVCLHLDQEESFTGILVGPDTVYEEQPIKSTLISLLLDEGNRVQVIELSRVHDLEILDEDGANDLRFFLQTSLGQEAYRRVTIRLTPGEHDLSVSYIAPAPTWRVSYRLVTDTMHAGGTGTLLLQGWGIFDNQLEEDLKNVQLSLVAGMPISFVYDLYTPFMPERPVVEEESRVAPGPVEFGASRGLDLGAEPEAEAPMAPPMAAMRAIAPAPRGKARRRAEALEASAVVKTKGKELGELFQYSIETPVTVSRGQSAMVPILTTKLDFHKDLIYNGKKLPTHPVATLRVKNETDLTLERGPVTIIENGEYVGEAILPFTAPSGEIVTPYAVELGIKVSEERGTNRETREIAIKGVYLQFEEWEIRWCAYQLDNSTGKPIEVLVEHPRTTGYTRFATPEPEEQTDEQLRFAVTVPAHGEAMLKVQERRLQRRREKLLQQSYEGLRRYLEQGLLDQKTLDKLAKLLILWESIATYEDKLKACDQERQKIYAMQQQIQGNMGALAQVGKEGALRTRYVDQLASTEEDLKKLDKREADLKTEIERVKQEIEERIKKL